MMTGARVFGPALAGLLITTVGFGWAFLSDGLSYFAVLAGLWLMNPAELRSAPITPRGKGQVREGLRYARGVPELWVPLVMMAVLGTLAFNFQTVLPLFATRDLDGTDGTFTLLMSVVSVGSVIGALSTARRRKSISVGTVSRAAIGFGLALTLLSIAPNQPIALAFGVLLGLSSITFMTTSTAIVQILADPTMRGRVLALQAIVFLGSTPIGGPIVGFISEEYGARYSLALGAAAAIGAGIWGALAVRRRDAAEALERDDALALGRPAVPDLVASHAAVPPIESAASPRAS
jgi:predicted MFS family arabinose efflux permease